MTIFVLVIFTCYFTYKIDSEYDMIHLKTTEMHYVLWLVLTGDYMYAYDSKVSLFLHLNHFNPDARLPIPKSYT